MKNEKLHLQILDDVVATFCIEFLRFRRLSHIRIVEVIAITAAITAAKTVFKYARRNHNENYQYRDPFSSKFRRSKMQTRSSQMGDSKYKVGKFYAGKRRKD